MRVKCAGAARVLRGVRRPVARASPFSVSETEIHPSIVGAAEFGAASGSRTGGGDV